MLYTFIFTGSHTIGNLIVTEAMIDDNRDHSQLLAYRVPHSLNDQVQITTEAATEAEARALLRRACERLSQKFATIILTANQHVQGMAATQINNTTPTRDTPTYHDPTTIPTVRPAHQTLTITVRTGTILHDTDIK